MEYTMIREVTLLSVVLRILAAVIVGGLLGMGRGMKNRPAGLRTYMVVCVGACLIMLTNQYTCQIFGTGDPVRMGAQVVSGIGFLGAGTIIVTRHRQIKGLTTAAGLWSVAGVGLALGVGFYEAAIAGALAVFLVITVLQKLDAIMHNRTKRLDLYFELAADVTLGEFLRSSKAQELEVSDLHRESDSDVTGTTRSYTVTIKTAQRMPHTQIIEKVSSIPGVLYCEEL